MSLELAEVFARYGETYRQKYGSRMPGRQRQVMRAVEACRTARLGGQVARCPDCQTVQYRYHSCRNRHCPKCQSQKGTQWLDTQQACLLPVPYFFLTFTLPEAIRAAARRHPEVFYGLLFRASAAATQKLAQDPRFVGGQIGMIGVLHTWGRTLTYHPHVHYLVPGGGLAADGQTWLPARKTFLMPVKALARLFRGAFRHALRQTPYYAEVPATAWQQAWIVHCQPLGDGRPALKYLAPYIFRVALSNRRLVRLEAGQVTFRYRATDTGKLKQSTLRAEEFIRRFLQHVLPKGFVKVRYYGFFSPRHRNQLAALQQRLMDNVPEAASSAEKPQTPTTPKLPEPLHWPCPHCGQAMHLWQILPPQPCQPP